MVSSMIYGKEDEQIENNIESNEKNDLDNNKEIEEKTIKEYENKEYVYLRESYDVEYTYLNELYKKCIERPYINIDSEDAKKANQEIYTMYNDAIKSTSNIEENERFLFVRI